MKFILIVLVGFSSFAFAATVKQGTRLNYVSEAIAAAWPNFDSIAFVPGEFSEIEGSVSIQHFPALANLQQGSSVQRIAQQNPTNTVYDFNYQNAAIDNDDNQTVSESEGELCVEKTPGGCAQNPVAIAAQEFLRKIILGSPMNPPAAPLGLVAFAGIRNICETNSVYAVTCHNLTIYTETVDAPLPVSQRQNCEGLSQCLWTKKVIEFDLIVHPIGKRGLPTEKKIQITAKFSDDGPALSHLTDLCYTGVVDSYGQNVIVLNCLKVKDFGRGTL